MVVHGTEGHDQNKSLGDYRSYGVSASRIPEGAWFWCLKYFTLIYLYTYGVSAFHELHGSILCRMAASISVILQVRVNTQKGDKVAVTGAHKVLGEWNPYKARCMKPIKSLHNRYNLIMPEMLSSLFLDFI